MPLDTVRLDTLARALAKGTISLRPSGLERTCRCTGCRSFIHSGHGSFIEAPADFVTAHDLGAHLCTACARQVQARAQTAPLS